MTQPNTELTLQVARTFEISREQVFAAWTDPESVRRWFGPRKFSNASAELDVRVGGAYRIAMRGPDGETFYAVGTYREVSPPERLVFSWGWEASPDARESIVTVEFFERGGGTEVVLTHVGLADTASRDSHQDGWDGTLERLAAVLTRDQA